MSRIVSEQHTLELVPSGYDSSNSSYSSISSSYPITNAYDGSDSTNYAYITCRTGSHASTYISLTFNINIPNDATINSVACVCKSRISSTNYISTAVLQLYAGATAKGSTTDYRSTTASARNLSPGSSWTVSEANSIQLRATATRGTSNTSRAAYIYMYGADLTITYTVSGTAYTITASSNVSGVTVTPASQELMQGETANVSVSTNSGIKVTDNGNDVTSQLVAKSETGASYTVETAPGASYGFSLNNNDYYVSGNKGVDKSAAVCIVNIHTPVAATVTFSYINYAEATYDFGIFGNIDVPLNNNYKPASGSMPDSDYRKACNTNADNSSSVQTLAYTLTAGDHFIYVKFTKDDASASNNDTLQFKVAITLDEPFTPGTYYEYSMPNLSADHTILVVAAGGSFPIRVKQNGAWVQATKVYVKQNGSWIQATKVLVKDNGTWK